MDYFPKPGDVIVIEDWVYEHTSMANIPNIVMASSGAKATVYQLRSPYGDMLALKVFEPRFQEERNVKASQALNDFSSFRGLGACARRILVEKEYLSFTGDGNKVFLPASAAKTAGLIKQKFPVVEKEIKTEVPKLQFSILMPWMKGAEWKYLIQNKYPLTKKQSAVLGKALLSLLLDLERAGLAHGDISCRNVLISWEDLDHSEPEIHLVDVEDMYAEGLEPALVFGTPGYTHKEVARGIWSPEMDRFAVLIMLVEILCWFDERVRIAANDHSLFHQGEIQGKSEIFELCSQVLKENYGSRFSEAFAAGWRSETLSGCPSISDLYDLFSPEDRHPGDFEKILKGEISKSKSLFYAGDLQGALGILENIHACVEEHANDFYSVLLAEKAEAFLQEGDNLNAYLTLQQAVNLTSVELRATNLTKKIDALENGRLPRRK